MSYPCDLKGLSGSMDKSLTRGLPIKGYFLGCWASYIWYDYVKKLDYTLTVHPYTSCPPPKASIQQGPELGNFPELGDEAGCYSHSEV